MQGGVNGVVQSTLNRVQLLELAGKGNHIELERLMAIPGTDPNCTDVVRLHIPGMHMLYIFYFILPLDHC